LSNEKNFLANPARASVLWFYYLGQLQRFRFLNLYVAQLLSTAKALHALSSATVALPEVQTASVGVGVGEAVGNDEAL
jgi:hypothetical protein